MGEGFGYPGLQSMALEVPVIITDFSGCKEYANSNTATMLKVRGFILHKNMDNILQFRNKKWAFVEVKEIREKMRYVLENEKQVKLKTKEAYHYVNSNFNFETVGNIFVNMLREIYD
jgi:glycosyltransferase involved in cell wall biosynthesis